MRLNKCLRFTFLCGVVVSTVVLSGCELNSKDLLGENPENWMTELSPVESCQLKQEVKLSAESSQYETLIPYDGNVAWCTRKTAIIEAIRWGGGTNLTLGIDLRARSSTEKLSLRSAAFKDHNGREFSFRCEPKYESSSGVVRSFNCGQIWEAGSGYLRDETDYRPSDTPVLLSKLVVRFEDCVRQVHWVNSWNTACSDSNVFKRTGDLIDIDRVRIPALWHPN